MLLDMIVMLRHDGSSPRRTRTLPQHPFSLSLRVLLTVSLILLQLKNALAFGLLQQQPTQRSIHPRSLLLTPLFARSYSRDDNQRSTRAVNHRRRASGPPNAVSTQDLVQQIRSSRKCMQLSNVVRENPSLFYSDDSIRALVPKVAELKPQMSARDIAGLLNVLAKARVPPKSQRVHQKLMLALGALAVLKIDDFEARDIAMSLNAFAKKGFQHSQLFGTAAEAAIPIIVNAFAKMDHHHPILFDEVAKAAIPIIDTFNSQSLTNTVNAFAKMDHQHPILFDEVAKAAIPIIDTFNSQGLANTVNAFAKMDHQHPI
eukprot:scaffold5419_cov128-Cylindrotheca_fusiformis.AAC.2